MRFNKALEELEAGKKIRLASWNKSFYIEIVTNCDSERGYSRSIILFSDGGYIEGWKATDREILSKDWEVLLPEVVCDIVVKCPKCKQEVPLFDAEEYELLNCPCGFQYKPVKPKRK
jgi:DNA-directed RNA polymerase subunit RPC12/RpoP